MNNFLSGLNYFFAAELSRLESGSNSPRFKNSLIQTVIKINSYYFKITNNLIN